MGELKIRCGNTERELWVQAADSVGTTLSAWVRGALNSEAHSTVVPTDGSAVRDGESAGQSGPATGAGALPGEAKRERPAKAVSPSGGQPSRSADDIPWDLSPTPEARRALDNVQSGRTPYKPPEKTK